MSDTVLREGSTCSVFTDKDDVSEGTFTGYVMLGTESAIVIKMDKSTRIIPMASIIYIDLKGSPEIKGPDGKTDSVYYG